MCSPIVLEALLSGVRIEPLLHPKPGAVTRFYSHSDKDVIDFSIAVTPLESSVHYSCEVASNRCGGSIASGFRVYRILYDRFNIGKSNINLGTLLLLIPLAVAHGRYGESDPYRLFNLATDIVFECSGVDEAIEYYKLLEYFKPSHLGYYQGPIPSVGLGYPSSFIKILHTVSWDIVHSELITGYKVTKDALDYMYRIEGGLEERSLWTLLYILKIYGDTLIARKHGLYAYKQALREAQIAEWYAMRHGIRTGLSFLDSLWRSRGWNPGSSLDILAIVIGAYNLGLLIQGGYASL